MGPIVCATRGGEACRRTQEQAVALARERGAELIFLFVVDPESVGPCGPELAAVIEDEMNRMATSLLRIAQARAREQGVEREIAVRQGPLRQAIEDFLGEVGASLLVIGAPCTCVIDSVFEPQDIHPFAEAIAEATGVEVTVA